MRMLMMFGPMLLRQFQKFQRNKERQSPQQPEPAYREDNRSDNAETTNQEKTYKETDFV